MLTDDFRGGAGFAMQAKARDLPPRLTRYKQCNPRATLGKTLATFEELWLVRRWNAV